MGCVADSISALEEDDGFATLTRMLSCNDRSAEEEEAAAFGRGGCASPSSNGSLNGFDETVRAEAAGVVAQITSPSLNLGRPIPVKLEAHLETIIDELTLLAEGERGVQI